MPLDRLKRGRTKGTPSTLVFREFQESLNLIEDFRQVALNILGTVKEVVPVESLALFVYDSDLTEFRALSSFGIEESLVKTLSFTPHDRLAKWLKVNKTFLDVRDQPSVFEFLGEKERGIFRSLGFELCFPLLSMNRLIGILCLGPNLSSEGYSKNDRAFLESLASQAGIALENALLYKEQRERYRRMLRADRLATIGELAAGAAHEIRNPLTAVQSTLQYLKSGSREENKTRLLGRALQETARIDEILSALLSFSRPTELKKEKLDLLEVLEDTLALVVFQARARKVTTHKIFPDPPVLVDADKSQLKQLFLNVYLNAFQAMEKGGEMRVDVVSAGGGKAVVRISDTGEGIAEEDMERIFDPFFTTKKGGTGLGLSICYGIAKSHRGDIEIRSRRGEGTEVIVTLPLT